MGELSGKVCNQVDSFKVHEFSLYHNLEGMQMWIHLARNMRGNLMP